MKVQSGRISPTTIGGDQQKLNQLKQFDNFNTTPKYIAWCDQQIKNINAGELNLSTLSEGVNIDASQLENLLDHVATINSNITKIVLPYTQVGETLLPNVDNLQQKFSKLHSLQIVTDYDRNTVQEYMLSLWAKFGKQCLVYNQFNRLIDPEHTKDMIAKFAKLIELLTSDKLPLNLPENQQRLNKLIQAICSVGSRDIGFHKTLQTLINKLQGYDKYSSQIRQLQHYIKKNSNYGALPPVDKQRLQGIQQTRQQQPVDFATSQPEQKLNLLQLIRQRINQFIGKKEFAQALPHINQLLELQTQLKLDQSVLAEAKLDESSLAKFYLSGHVNILFSNDEYEKNNKIRDNDNQFIKYLNSIKTALGEESFHQLILILVERSFDRLQYPGNFQLMNVTQIVNLLRYSLVEFKDNSEFIDKANELFVQLDSQSSLIDQSQFSQITDLRITLIRKFVVVADHLTKAKAHSVTLEQLESAINFMYENPQIFSDAVHEIPEAQVLLSYTVQRYINIKRSSSVIQPSVKLMLIMLMQENQAYSEVYLSVTIGNGIRVNENSLERLHKQGGVIDELFKISDAESSRENKEKLVFALLDQAIQRHNVILELTLKNRNRLLPDITIVGYGAMRRQLRYDNPETKDGLVPLLQKVYPYLSDKEVDGERLLKMEHNNILILGLLQQEVLRLGITAEKISQLSALLDPTNITPENIQETINFLIPILNSIALVKRIFGEIVYIRDEVKSEKPSSSETLEDKKSPIFNLLKELIKKLIGSIVVNASDGGGNSVNVEYQIKLFFIIHKLYLIYKQRTPKPRFTSQEENSKKTPEELLKATPEGTFLAECLPNFQSHQQLIAAVFTVVGDVKISSNQLSIAVQGDGNFIIEILFQFAGNLFNNKLIDLDKYKKCLLKLYVTFPSLSARLENLTYTNEGEPSKQVFTKEDLDVLPTSSVQPQKNPVNQYQDLGDFQRQLMFQRKQKNSISMLQAQVNAGNIMQTFGQELRNCIDWIMSDIEINSLEKADADILTAMFTLLTSIGNKKINFSDQSRFKIWEFCTLVESKYVDQTKQVRTACNLPVSVEGLLDLINTANDEDLASAIDKLFSFLPDLRTNNNVLEPIFNELITKKHILSIHTILVMIAPFSQMLSLDEKVKQFLAIVNVNTFDNDQKIILAAKFLFQCYCVKQDIFDLYLTIILNNYKTSLLQQQQFAQILFNLVNSIVVPDVEFLQQDQEKLKLVAKLGNYIKGIQPQFIFRTNLQGLLNYLQSEKASEEKGSKFYEELSYVLAAYLDLHVGSQYNNNDLWNIVEIFELVKHHKVNIPNLDGFVDMVGQVIAKLTKLENTPQSISELQKTIDHKQLTKVFTVILRYLHSLQYIERLSLIKQDCKRENLGGMKSLDSFVQILQRMKLSDTFEKNITEQLNTLKNHFNNNLQLAQVIVMELCQNKSEHTDAIALKFVDWLINKTKFLQDLLPEEYQNLVITLLLMVDASKVNEASQISSKKGLILAENVAENLIEIHHEYAVELAEPIRGFGEAPDNSTLDTHQLEFFSKQLLLLKPLDKSLHNLAFSDLANAMIKREDCALVFASATENIQIFMLKVFADVVTKARKLEGGNRNYQEQMGKIIGSIGIIISDATFTRELPTVVVMRLIALVEQIIPFYVEISPNLKNFIFKLFPENPISKNPQLTLVRFVLLLNRKESVFTRLQSYAVGNVSVTQQKEFVSTYLTNLCGALTRYKVPQEIVSMIIEVVTNNNVVLSKINGFIDGIISFLCWQLSHHILDVKLVTNIKDYLIIQSNGNLNNYVISTIYNNHYLLKQYVDGVINSYPLKLQEFINCLDNSQENVAQIKSALALLMIPQAILDLDTSRTITQVIIDGIVNHQGRKLDFSNVALNKALIQLIATHLPPVLPNLQVLQLGIIIGNIKDLQWLNAFRQIIEINFVSTTNSTYAAQLEQNVTTFIEDYSELFLNLAQINKDGISQEFTSRHAQILSQLSGNANNKIAQLQPLFKLDDTVAKLIKTTYLSFIPKLNPTDLKITTPQKNLFSALYVLVYDQEAANDDTLAKFIKQILSVDSKTKLAFTDASHPKKTTMKVKKKGGESGMRTLAESVENPVFAEAKQPNDQAGMVQATSPVKSRVETVYGVSSDLHPRKDTSQVPESATNTENTPQVKTVPLDLVAVDQVTSDAISQLNQFAQIQDAKISKLDDFQQAIADLQLLHKNKVIQNGKSTNANFSDEILAKVVAKLIQDIRDNLLNMFQPNNNVKADKFMVKAFIFLLNTFKQDKLLFGKHEQFFDLDTIIIGIHTKLQSVKKLDLATELLVSGINVLSEKQFINFAEGLINVRSTEGIDSIKKVKFLMMLVKACQINNKITYQNILIENYFFSIQPINELVIKFWFESYGVLDQIFANEDYDKERREQFAIDMVSQLLGRVELEKTGLIIKTVKPGSLNLLKNLVKKLYANVASARLKGQILLLKFNGASICTSGELESFNWSHAKVWNDKNRNFPVLNRSSDWNEFKSLLLDVDHLLLNQAFASPKINVNQDLQRVKILLGTLCAKIFRNKDLLQKNTMDINATIIMDIFVHIYRTLYLNQSRINRFFKWILSALSENDAAKLTTVVKNGLIVAFNKADHRNIKKVLMEFVFDQSQSLNADVRNTNLPSQDEMPLADGNVKVEIPAVANNIELSFVSDTDCNKKGFDLPVKQTANFTETPDSRFFSIIDYSSEIATKNNNILDSLYIRFSKSINALPNNNFYVAPGRQQILDIFEIAKTNKTGKTAVLGDVDGSFERIVLFALATNQITFTELGFNKFSQLFNLFLEQNWRQKKLWSKTVWVQKNQLINDVLQEMIFLENTPENPIFMGDIIHDRNTVNPELMLAFCNALKQNNKKAIFIRGNHDSEYWALFAAQCVEKDTYQVLESASVHFYGNFDIETLKSEEYSRCMKAINQVDTYQIFVNCHYDESLRRLYIHNGATYYLDTNNIKYYETGFGQFQTITDILNFVEQINKVRDDNTLDLTSQTDGETIIDIMDQFNNFKPSSRGQLEKIVDFAKYFGCTVLHGHADPSVANPLDAGKDKAVVLGFNQRAGVMTNLI